MPPKFGRSYQLDIKNFGATSGTADTLWSSRSINGLDDFGGTALKIEFEVTKSLDSTANRATVRVYNLSELSRGRISGLVKRKVGRLSPTDRAILFSAGAAGPLPEITYSNLGVAYLRLWAGYGLDMAPIFEGSTERIEHWRPDNVTWVTELHAADGRKALEESTMNKSYAVGTPATVILQDMVRHLGVTISPVDLAIVAGGFTRTGAQVSFPYGFTAVGSTYELLKQFLELLEVQWSIQDGEFVLYNEQRVLPFPPVEMGPGTGLVGSPERGDAGIVHIDALLDWRLRPGQTVLLVTKTVQGTFRVNEVRHEGDSYGDGPWRSRCELEDLALLQAGAL